MNTYEMVNIIDVTSEIDDKLSQAEEMIKQEIIKAGGKIIDIGSMGEMKLAYPINDHTEGLYLLSHFTLPPESVVNLRDSLKLNNSVIRSLIVRYKKRPVIKFEQEETDEEKIELTDSVVVDFPADDIVDDDISIISKDSEESFDDLELKVNINSVQDEDTGETGLKEV